MSNEQAAANAALKTAKERAYLDRLRQRYTNTSAEDLRIDMERHAEREPATTLSEISLVLNEMNEHGIEKKSHRQALARAGRLALKRLAELPA